MISMIPYDCYDSMELILILISVLTYRRGVSVRGLRYPWMDSPLGRPKKKHFFDKEFNSGCNRSRHELGLGGKGKVLTEFETILKKIVLLL